jgi:hypothetical protein
MCRSSDVPRRIYGTRAANCEPIPAVLFCDGSTQEHISARPFVLPHQKGSPHETYKPWISCGADTYKHVRARAERHRFCRRELHDGGASHRRHHGIVRQRNDNRNLDDWHAQQWSRKRRCRGKQRSEPVGKQRDQSIAQRIDLEPGSRCGRGTVDKELRIFEQKAPAARRGFCMKSEKCHHRTIRPRMRAARSISFSFHAAKPRNNPCSLDL